MIDRAALLSDLQRLLGTLEADLRQRSDEVPEIKADLVAQHADALRDKRTAAPYLEWREELITQIGVAWILGCVFVRFLEDNDFLDTPFLSGPGERLRAAQDQHLLYIRENKAESDRAYLLHVFATVGRLPALERLYGAHNPLHVFGPSADGAQTLLRFWQTRNADTGALVHDFTDPAADTRFVGDLYQDLSEAARKRYALLQTPILLRWDSYPGRFYVVEETDDLSVWNPISAQITGDGAEKTFPVPLDPADRRMFWRVRVSEYLAWRVSEFPRPSIPREVCLKDDAASL